MRGMGFPSVKDNIPFAVSLIQWLITRFRPQLLYHFQKGNDLVYFPFSLLMQRRFSGCIHPLILNPVTNLPGRPLTPLLSFGHTAYGSQNHKTAGEAGMAPMNNRDEARQKAALYLIYISSTYPQSKKLWTVYQSMISSGPEHWSDLKADLGPWRNVCNWSVSKLSQHAVNLF